MNLSRINLQTLIYSLFHVIHKFSEVAKWVRTYFSPGPGVCSRRTVFTHQSLAHNIQYPACSKEEGEILVSYVMPSKNWFK